MNDNKIYELLLKDSDKGLRELIKKYSSYCFYVKYTVNI